MGETDGLKQVVEEEKGKLFIGYCRNKSCVSDPLKLELQNAVKGHLQQFGLQNAEVSCMCNFKARCSRSKKTHLPFM